MKYSVLNQANDAGDFNAIAEHTTVQTGNNVVATSAVLTYASKIFFPSPFSGSGSGSAAASAVLYTAIHEKEAAGKRITNDMKKECKNRRPILRVMYLSPCSRWGAFGFPLTWLRQTYRNNDGSNHGFVVVVERGSEGFRKFLKLILKSSHKQEQSQWIEMSSSASNTHKQ